MDYEGRSFKAQMRMANRRGALAALLVGEEELGRGVVGLKDMREGGGQEEASLGGLEAAVARLLRPSASSSPAES
jgi:histidyl-tRNA synthetase